MTKLVMAKKIATVSTILNIIGLFTDAASVEEVSDSVAIAVSSEETNKAAAEQASVSENKEASATDVSKEVDKENKTADAEQKESKEVKSTDYCKDIHGTYGYETGFFVDLNSLQELDDCYQMEMSVTWTFTGDPSAPKDVIRIEKNAPAMLFPLDNIKSGAWLGGSETTFSKVVSEHPGGKIWMCDIDTGSNGYITSITTLTVSG